MARLLMPSLNNPNLGKFCKENTWDAKEPSFRIRFRKGQKWGLISMLLIVMQFLVLWVDLIGRYWRSTLLFTKKRIHYLFWRNGMQIKTHITMNHVLLERCRAAWWRRERLWGQASWRGARMYIAPNRVRGRQVVLVHNCFDTMLCRYLPSGPAFLILKIINLAFNKISRVLLIRCYQKMEFQGCWESIFIPFK